MRVGEFADEKVRADQAHHFVSRLYRIPAIYSRNPRPPLHVIHCEGMHNVYRYRFRPIPERTSSHALVHKH